MTCMDMDVMSVPLMAAMMLPSAVPAVARHARERHGVLAAPVFAGSYIGIWALVSLLVFALYQPPDAVGAGAAVVAAGLYELTPLKCECRRRCRARTRSGIHFATYCVGSSIGLMLIVVALDPMSVALMSVTAAVVLAQKLLPPHPVIDVPLALAIAALGVVLAVA